MSQITSNNSIYNSMPAIMRCRLRKCGQNGFGFSVKQRSSAPTLSIGELYRNGEAEKSGLIRPGDIILKVNDTDVSQCSYDEAVGALTSAGATQKDSLVSFVIRAPIGYTTRLETTFSSDGTPKTVRITEKIPMKSVIENETSVESHPQPQQQHQKITANNDNVLNTKRGSAGNKEALNLMNSNFNLSAGAVDGEPHNHSGANDAKYV
jgi:hypothetical protein